MNIIHKQKHKNPIVRPDYVLKDIPKSERANLPPRMKVLFFLHIKEETVPAWMFHDCMLKYPQYFEKDLKIYGTGR